MMEGSKRTQEPCPQSPRMAASSLELWLWLWRCGEAFLASDDNNGDGELVRATKCNRMRYGSETEREVILLNFFSNYPLFFPSYATYFILMPSSHQEPLYATFWI